MILGKSIIDHAEVGVVFDSFSLVSINKNVGVFVPAAKSLLACYMTASLLYRTAVVAHDFAVTEVRAGQTLSYGPESPYRGRSLLEV